jgi:hypothetical protein
MSARINRISAAAIEPGEAAMLRARLFTSLPNLPHLEPEVGGNVALAKVREALLTITGG